MHRLSLTIADRKIDIGQTAAGFEFGQNFLQVGQMRLCRPSDWNLVRHIRQIRVDADLRRTSAFGVGFKTEDKARGFLLRGVPHAR